MACINKLNQAITFGCTGGSVGLAELLLVNTVDVASKVIVNNVMTDIVFYSGANAYKVDCHNNGAKMVEALRLLDGASGVEQTLTVTVYDKTDAGARIIEALTSGKFIAFGKLEDGSVVKIQGALTGLEAATSDSDTSASGGFCTVTLKTPDGARGDKTIVASTSGWDYLKVNEQTA